MATQVVNNFRSIQRLTGGDGRTPSPEFLLWTDTLIKQINAQYDAVNARINLITGATAGNLPRIAADGSLEDSSVPGSFAAKDFSVADAVTPAVAVTTPVVSGGVAPFATLSDLNAKLATLATETNAIKTALNNVITALQNAGMMEE